MFDLIIYDFIGTNLLRFLLIPSIYISVSNPLRTVRAQHLSKL